MNDSMTTIEAIGDLLNLATAIIALIAARAQRHDK